MSLFKMFDVTGSAMSAQMLRLNVVASNLANVDSIASSPDAIYRARNPVFKALVEGQMQQGEAIGVGVQGVVESTREGGKVYNPGHPLADQDGFIYTSNVNVAEEMANMISASRSYQTNVEVMNTSKQMLAATLKLGE